MVHERERCCYGKGAHPRDHESQRKISADRVTPDERPKAAGS